MHTLKKKPSQPKKKAPQNERQQGKPEIETSHYNKANYFLFVRMPLYHCREHFLFIIADHLKPRRSDFIQHN